jgi:hypothetical protein
MADVVLHPTERGRRAREAALEAGRRLGWPVPEGLLNRIEAATAGLRLGPADAERVAVGVVERARQDDVRGAGPGSWEASNRQASGSFRIIFGQVVHDIAGLPPGLAAREEESGGRFGDLANADLTSTPEMSSALNRADRCGMGWLRQNRDLLQLGPAGIQALVDARFRRESFNRLREAGFEGREAARMAVGISRYATRHGLDANRIAEETARGVEVFGGDSPEARRRWIERFNRFYANPDDAQAREEMGRALSEIETSPSSTPEQREQVERMRPLLRLEQQERRLQHTMEVQANTAVIAHTAAATANDDLMADLNAGPVAPTGQRADTEPRPPASQRTTVAENTVQPSGPRLS